METRLTTEQRRLLEDSLNDAAAGKASVSASYPKPTVEPVNAFGVLEPDTDDAVNKTYIVIQDIPAPYLVLFLWNDDTSSIPPQTSTGELMRVKVPPALVIAAANLNIRVIYSVLDPNSSTPIPSEPLILPVGNYTAPTYPKPVIKEASNGVLDVSALTANAQMTLADWPGQTVGQKLWLSVVSTPQITLENWNPLDITMLGPQNTLISQAPLKTLTNESTFTLKLDASFDGGATRFPFSEQSYSIKSVPEVTAVTIASVKDSTGNAISNGGTTTDTTVTIDGTVTFA